MRITLDPGAKAPARAHPTDAGLDLFALEGGIVRAHSSASFRTGVHVQLPPGTMGDIRPRSGLMFTRNLLTFGTVDEGYTGEVMVRLFNLGDEDQFIPRYGKIAQLTIHEVRYEPVEIVDAIEGGERGNSGFGSTGE